MAMNEKENGAGAIGDGRGERSSTVWIVAVSFLIVVLDGLDTTSIAFVAPLLAAEWGISPAAFTPAFIATSVGAVIGYMACGPLAQRIGFRAVGVGSVILFGLGTALTAAAGDIFSLSVLRLVAAIGLGGALPIAVTAATQVAAPRRKETVAMLVASGLSAGGVLGGVIGGPLMKSFGWTSVFIVGGVLPLLLAPAFGRILAGTEARQRAEAPNTGEASPVADLFRNGLSRHTMLLWMFAFLVFCASYALTFWIPTLLTSFGFDPSQVPLGAAAFGAGGLLGALAMMTLVGRWGIRNVLMLAMLLAMASIAVISQAAVAPGMVLPLVAGAGAGLITGCIGQSALAVSFYAPALRATGVGWAAAAGRIGSIVGPGLGGAMMSLDWSARDVILSAVLPTLLAAATLLVLGLVERRTAQAETAR